MQKRKMNCSTMEKAFQSYDINILINRSLQTLFAIRKLRTTFANTNFSVYICNLQIANTKKMPMRKHNGMRPQDILILLKMVVLGPPLQSNSVLVRSLKISAAEISEALERCRIAKLVDVSKKRVNVKALEEFLLFGVKYVFPAQPEGITRGVSTAFSASPIKEHVVQSNEKYVWRYSKGTERGQAIEPLYKTVPEIIAEEAELYELLVIVDTLRVGRVREVEIATKELKTRLDKYGRE